jgi:hypothetical protein
VTITAATITPTLINSGITKIYDGLTTAPLTFVPTYTFTGLISGDTAASLNYTAANYNTPNVSTANSITVSGMSVASITGTNNSASTDYVLNSSSKNIAASITPKTISLSATKTYDGTTSLSGAVSITTGVGNETLTSTNAIASDAHVVTANKYITAITLANGTGLASNYQLPTLDVSNAAVTINAAVLTPTLSNTGVSKTYDGTTNGPGGFTPTYTFSGLANGDSTALLNYTSTTYNNANVASASQVTVSGLSIAAITGTRASAPTDYVLDATAKHVNAVITPKTLIVQANDDAQFVTRADAINFAGASYSGFVTNESTANLSGTLSITRTNSTTTAAGVYNNVLLPSGLSSTNYNIVNQAGQYTIVPANQLLVRVANSTTTYGTSPALSISSAQYLASDNTTIRDLTSSINTSNGVFSLTDGSSGSAQFGLSLNNPTLSGAGMPTVGIWDITANNINRTSSNFSNNLVVVGSQTINPKPLTINVTATNKVYDGTAIATPSLSTTDVLTGDNVNLLVGAANFANKNAGTAKTVAATGLGLNGTDIGNYVLQNISAITTADITPKTLTISVTAPDKVYDGTTTAAPSLSITAGLVGNETLLVDGTASFNSKNVRDAQRVTVDSVHLSDGTQGGLASNYSLPTGQSTTAHITPKPLTASVVAEDKNYDGKLTATTALTITSGLIGQETLNASSEASFSDINAGIKKTVTVDSINLNDASDGSGGLASNYSLMPGQTTTATIRPKMLVPNQEPKVRISNDSALSIPRNEPVQLSSIIEPQIELPVETSEGIVFNHFKAPTEKSIGIMAIRLPKDIAYTSKDLTVALADEIDFSHSHDIENIRIKTVDNQPAPSWIRFDAAQKALIISDQASKETLPLQLILHMGEHRYLMQISESNYITPTL